MMSEQTELVTKREAMKLCARHIDMPGSCIDVNVLLELLTWEKKLLLWVLEESKEAGTLNELLPELSGELREVLKVRQEQSTEVC